MWRNSKLTVYFEHAQETIYQHIYLKITWNYSFWNEKRKVRFDATSQPSPIIAIIRFLGPSFDRKGENILPSLSARLLNSLLEIHKEPAWTLLDKITYATTLTKQMSPRDLTLLKRVQEKLQSARAFVEL